MLCQEDLEDLGTMPGGCGWLKDAPVTSPLLLYSKGLVSIWDILFHWGQRTYLCGAWKPSGLWPKRDHRTQWCKFNQLSGDACSSPLRASWYQTLPYEMGWVCRSQKGDPCGRCWHLGGSVTCLISIVSSCSFPGSPTVKKDVSEKVSPCPSPSPWPQWVSRCMLGYPASLWDWETPWGSGTASAANSLALNVIGCTVCPSQWSPLYQGLGRSEGGGPALPASVPKGPKPNWVHRLPPTTTKIKVIWEGRHNTVTYMKYPWRDVAILYISMWLAVEEWRVHMEIEDYMCRKSLTVEHRSTA